MTESQRKFEQCREIFFYFYFTMKIEYSYIDNYEILWRFVNKNLRSTNPNLTADFLNTKCFDVANRNYKKNLQLYTKLEIDYWGKWIRISSQDFKIKNGEYNIANMSYKKTFGFVRYLVKVKVINGVNESGSDLRFSDLKILIFMQVYIF